MDLFDLSGRVAVVTGGNGGIGLGMARGLAAAGAAVVVPARNRDKSQAAVAALTALGVPSAFIALDVGDPPPCHAVMPQTRGPFGRPRILVQHAAISIRQPPHAYSIPKWPPHP